MPANAPRSLQIYDPVLTGLARRYKPDGFIGDQLLADIPVDTLSGQYPVFPKSFWFQNDVDNEVTDRTPAKEIDFEWSTDTYLCKEYALKISYSDLEVAQAHGALRFQKSKTEFLTHRMQLAHEVRVATLLRKTDVSGGGLNLGATPSVNWDQATAVIEEDIKLGVLAIYDATGMLPNTIVIPYKVAYAMCMQEDIRAILRSDATGKGVDYLKLGDRILPSVIHGMKVVIPIGPQVDSTKEGSATESISEIWGDHVRLLYVNSGASWGTPSVAYKLNHTAKKVTRWRTVDPDVNYVREMERYALKVVAPDCGYEIRAVLS
jgi:hypothetical protein